MTGFNIFRFCAIVVLWLSTVGSGGLTYYYCHTQMDLSGTNSAHQYLLVSRWVTDALGFCYITAYMLITSVSRRFQPGSIGDVMALTMSLFFPVFNIFTARVMVTTANHLGMNDVSEVIFNWSFIHVGQIFVTLVLVGVAVKVGIEEMIKVRLKVRLEPIGLRQQLFQLQKSVEDSDDSDGSLSVPMGVIPV